MNPGDSDKSMKWIYPDQEPPPRGVKIALLTVGNIEVTGSWSDDGRYKAWQRLFSRDKAHERKLADRAARMVATRRASPKCIDDPAKLMEWFRESIGLTGAPSPVEIMQTNIARFILDNPKDPKDPQSSRSCGYLW